MSLCIHLCSKLTPLLVTALSVVGKQRHGLYRECKHGLRTLLVKPLHEALLQPRKSVPVWLAAIREIEVTEQ